MLRRRVLSCLPAAAVLCAIEIARSGLGTVPIPFLLLLVSVGFAGFNGGLVSGAVAGGAAALYVLYSHLQGFGPATLTGNFAYTLVGMMLFGAVGTVLGRLRDDRDSYYDALLEAQRKEQEEPLKLASQLVDLGYYIWDIRQNIPIVVSDQHIRNYGVSRERFLSMVSDVGGPFHLVHPDDRAKVDEWCRVLKAGEDAEMEYRVLGSDGVRWIRAIVHPIRGASGEIERQVCASQDITHFKEAEARQFEAQKMESIGHLTGGVAHDFNNILAVIMGNLELLREDEEDEKRAAFVDAAIAATKRGAGLTRSMLSFARRARLQPEVMDINVVVRDAENWMRRVLPASVEISTDLQTDAWPLRLDLSSLESALLNLALNARDAMKGHGTLAIRTANVRLGPEDAAVREDGLSPGSYVMLSVADTGCGIADEVRSRIFDPFFTTKSPGSGSGLGLSMVLGFVKQSSGAVQVDTEVGKGTTVRLYFPTSRGGETETAPEPTLLVKHTRTKASILLVEDEGDVRNILRAMLEDGGHQVTPAESGDAAFDIFRNDPTFDLVLTDIVMPGVIQGRELARQIRKIRPEQPVIFLSGYAPDPESGERPADPDDIRLLKPVPKADLLRAVASVVDPSTEG